MSVVEWVVAASSGVAVVASCLSIFHLCVADWILKHQRDPDVRFIRWYFRFDKEAKS